MSVFDLNDRFMFIVYTYNVMWIHGIYNIYKYILCICIMYVIYIIILYVHIRLNQY